MEYSEEFSKMQLEAMERLRQMQLRSKTAINEPPPAEPSPPTPPVVEANAIPIQHHHQPPQEIRNGDMFSNLLGGIGIGSDKLLILLVLFILYKNKADIKLLIALAYLML